LSAEIVLCGEFIVFKPLTQSDSDEINSNYLRYCTDYRVGRNSLREAKIDRFCKKFHDIKSH
jgi:hypothetical protein